MPKRWQSAANGSNIGVMSGVIVSTRKPALSKGVRAKSAMSLVNNTFGRELNVRLADEKRNGGGPVVSMVYVFLTELYKGSSVNSAIR
jgi:hypothetical protein